MERERPFDLKRFLSLAVLCTSGAILNGLVCHLLVTVLGLPLYGDTLFTAVLAFYGGMLPGVVTGLLHNMVFSPLSQYLFSGSAGSYGLVQFGFGLCNAAVAVCSALFARFLPGSRTFPPSPVRSQNVMHTVIVLFALSITLVLVESVMGGMVASFLLVDTPGSEIGFQWPLYQSGLSRLPVEIISRFPVNLLDRPLCIFPAYGLSVLLGRALTRLPSFRSRPPSVRFRTRP
jgi:hypothetical protein